MMGKKDGAETRRQRMAKMAKNIQIRFIGKKDQRKKEELILSTFVVFQMYETGLSEQNMVEYLEIIEKMGFNPQVFEKKKI